MKTLKVLLAIFDCALCLGSMVLILLTSILIFPFTPFSRTACYIVSIRNPETADYILKMMLKRIEDVT